MIDIGFRPYLNQAAQERSEGSVQPLSNLTTGLLQTSWNPGARRLGSCFERKLNLLQRRSCTPKYATLLDHVSIQRILYLGTVSPYQRYWAGIPAGGRQLSGCCDVLR